MRAWHRRMGELWEIVGGMAIAMTFGGLLEFETMVMGARVVAHWEVGVAVGGWACGRVVEVRQCAWTSMTVAFLGP